MVNLERMAMGYRSEGYSAQFSEARVCQDVVLKAIAESSLSRHVTMMLNTIHTLLIENC